MEKRNLDEVRSEMLTSWTGMSFDKYSNKWQLDQIAHLEWLNTLEPVLEVFLRDLLASVAMNKSFSYFEHFQIVMRDFFVDQSYSKLDSGVALSFISKRKKSERPKVKRALVFLYNELKQEGLLGVDTIGIGELEGVQYDRSVIANKNIFEREVGGPLTDSELGALLNLLHQGFASGEVSIKKYVAILLIVYTGRRPNQISQLKFKDFVEDAEGNYWINIPRIKGGRRTREVFRKVPIGDLSLWSLIKELQKDVLIEVEGRLGRSINKEFYSDLPLFPKHKWPTKMISDDKLYNQLDVLPTSHHNSKDLSCMIRVQIRQLEVPAERNDGTLKASPKNFRMTLLSRLVRKRVDPAIAAEIMDHETTAYLKNYFKNPADLSAVLEKLVKGKLAPLSRSFCKEPIESESEAEFGHNKLSRTYSAEGDSIGSCSSSNLGEGCRPLQCYTCRSFQPWLHADHRGVLSYLEELIQRHAKNGEDEEYIFSYVTTLLGVRSVVDSCDQTKQERDL